MKQITEITDDYNQKLDITTEDNQTFELKLTYNDQQQGWFYSVSFGELIINGSRIVAGANILRSYQNIIPFGFSIAPNDGSEPVFLDDFSSGRVSFFLLNEEEVQDIESDFYNN